jgi:hypothetical protein
MTTQHNESGTNTDAIDKARTPARTTSVEKFAGRITVWTPKDYGYIEIFDGSLNPQRVFIHITSFIGLPPTNVRGSFVEFTIGEDPEGRPCARNVVVVRGAK